MKFILSFFILCSALFCVVNGQGLKFETPWIEGFHPLDEEPFYSSPLNAENPVILKLELKNNVFKDTALIDFEKRQITFRRYDELGFRLWEYHYNELSDYLLARRNYALFKGWRSGLSVSKNDANKAKASVMKFQWEMPVHYPSWAQRVIGTDPPRLSINGSITITMGFDNNTVIESSADEDYATNNGFDFEVQYQFSISGSVGRLISINISADNQNEFEVSDVFKNFKIHYKESKPGELEDEIIQEAEIGWTGFQMPGTELSGYSENNGGLFGIKVRSQLGPLSLTSVISHERGEAVTLTKPISGASEDAVTEKDYVLNKFFFLDNKYRRHYNRKYGPQSSNPPPVPVVDTLMIFKSYQSNRDQASDTIKATLDDDQQQKFVRLHRDRHYFLNAEEGWIRFSDTIGELTSSIIAIYMRTKDSKYNKGEILKSSGKDTLWNLWVLKPKDPIDSAGADLDTSRFYLMWRNVYNIQSSDWSNFKFRIVQKTPDDDTEIDQIEGGKKISDLLGISVGGKYSLDKPHIFDKNNGYLIIPPFDTSFFGNEPFRNEALGKYRDSLIYKYSVERLRLMTYNTYYKLYAMRSQTLPVFQLGWDVMEGEIIKADGTLLKRNVDYIIDYSSGELELISAFAKNAKNITAEYQRSSMFVPEKKIFFGTRGELKLPFISDKSFAGLSFLHQNVKVNDAIPQLDQEPYNKSLLDFNIRIDLEPEWMTTLVNKIPLIRTDAESKMVIDFEFARSFMDPNPEGQAYVDDFEDSKQYSTLPQNASGWFQASPPFYDTLTPDSLHKYPPAWDFYWFSPRDEDQAYRIKIQEMKEITETVATAGTNDYADVLRLHCIPSPANDYNSRYTNAWAGIMAPVYGKDKTEEQYLEFSVLAPDGYTGKGKLLIQMGTVREDISINGGPPNQNEDTEDPTIYENPNRIDPSKDNGFDNIKIDSLEFYVIPSKEDGKLWDTLTKGNPLLGLDINDPGRDNFKKYEGKDGNVENRRYANRKQGDQKLTSEDINNDGMVYTHKNENYFQFTIDLAEANSPLIDVNANVRYDKGWRKYRIPLKEIIKDLESIRDTVGNPDWKNIEMVRLIWTGFEKSNLNREHQLVLADMQFVGSQWLPVYDSVGTKIEASSINNKDDNFYRSQVRNEPLVLVSKDNNGDEELESSLRLNFKNLKSGETNLVTRNYNYRDGINISAYNTLSMAVYGRNPDNSTLRNLELYEGKVDFVFRFGADDSTYYEYRSKIYSGWQEVKIDLREITGLKDKFLIANSDTVPIEITTSTGKAKLRVVSKAAGRQPNISKIQWVGIGVARGKGDNGSSTYSGEIWVNEMKVSGINDLSGRAIRANISTQWADFLSVSGSLIFTDGDFRRMTEREIQRKNSALSTSFGSSMNLNKFLPKDWGLTLPIGMNYNSSVTRPQMKSNSDILLTDKDGKSDNLIDLLTDKETPSRHYQQKNSTFSTYINFDKVENSDNPLVNMTVDRISGDFKFNKSNSQNNLGPSSVKRIDYQNTVESERYSGNLKYDLTPISPPEWTRWRPFKSLKGSSLNEYEISLLPESFTFNLIDVTQGTQRTSDTKRRIFDTTYTFDVRHGVDFRYTPIAPLLEMNYSLDITRDLQQYADGNTVDMAKNVLSLYKGNSMFAHQYLILEGEKNRNQNASISVDPKIFDWLSTTADYSTDYDGAVVRYRNDSTDFISAKVNNTFSFDAVFRFDQALQNLVDAAVKSKALGFFAYIDTFFNNVKLNSVSFNYTATQGLVNNYLSKDIIGSGFELLKYQLGLKGKDLESFFKADMDDDFLGGMRYRSIKNDIYDYYREDRRTAEQKYTISSSMSLTAPFQLSISPISLSWSKRYEVRPDTTFFDTTTTFPDFSIGLRSSALMKIEFIKNLMQNLEVNSNLNYRKTFRHNNSVDSDTTKEFSMSPLIRFQGTIKKWPINVSYGCKIAHSRTYDHESEAMKRRTGGHELDISYRIERNSRLSEINLLRWKIPVRGKTTMGLTGSRDVLEELKENKSVKRNEISYSIKPYLSYIFTDNITGSFEYTHANVDIDGKETRTRKLALIANIQFK